jgi:hypothetical protein
LLIATSHGDGVFVLLHDALADPETKAGPLSSLVVKNGSKALAATAGVEPAPLSAITIRSPRRVGFFQSRLSKMRMRMLPGARFNGVDDKVCKKLAQFRSETANSNRRLVRGLDDGAKRFRPVREMLCCLECRAVVRPKAWLTMHGKSFPIEG